VADPEPRPDLECQVGIISFRVNEIYKIKCTDAWNISVEIDQPQSNSLFSEGYISDQDRIRKIFRFGIKGSGLTYEAKHNWANWTRPVPNWVCGYEPVLGMVIYDCLPAYEAPLWWDDSYLGPNFDDGAPGANKIMRPPGCNGGVCYCNNFDYCNDKWNLTIADFTCPEPGPAFLPHHRAIDTRCRGNGRGRSPPPPEEW